MNRWIKRPYLPTHELTLASHQTVLSKFAWPGGPAKQHLALTRFSSLQPREPGQPSKVGGKLWSHAVAQQAPDDQLQRFAAPSAWMPDCDFDAEAIAQQSKLDPEAPPKTEINEVAQKSNLS